MKKTLGFCFSLLLLLCSPSLFAQDSIKYDIAYMHGFRLGVDVSRVVLPLIYKDKRMGIEFSVDKQVSKNGFVTAETGMLKMNSDRPEYHYTLNGAYIRLGYDRNIIRFREIGLRDLVYVGFRYGVARFSHKMDNIVVPPGYWEGTSAGMLQSDNLSAQWIEGMIGTKVELMHNFYLGMALRGKIKVSSPKDDYVVPILIPGFGRGDRGLVMSLSYSLFYTFDPSGKNK